ncbi:MAG: S-layer homology domain-containing protein [Chloroflexota bacterium]|nr:S-layer homology domain-containing protein [Chloroflexota bacterium]
MLKFHSVFNYAAAPRCSRRRCGGLLLGLAALLALVSGDRTAPPAAAHPAAWPAPGKAPLLTPTLAATTTPNPCQVYSVTTGSAALVAGVTDIGNHGDDVATTITLPFAVLLYGQTFTTAQVGSNGTLSFGTFTNTYNNFCLPSAVATYTIVPFWDDQCTADCNNFVCSGCGIFTTQVGNAFYIEWRTNLQVDGTTENYEVVLTQGSGNFRLIYGSGTHDTSANTVGVQGANGAAYTLYKCDTAGPLITPGEQLSFTAPCGAGTLTPTATATAGGPTATATAGSPTPTPPVVQQLAGGPGDQQAPQIDGNLLVWEDNSAGTWDIRARDLQTSLIFTVTAGVGDQRLPAVSGNLIVWQDNSSGTWDIYGAQVTNDVAGPPFLIAGGAGDQTNPAVSGNQVVWQSPGSSGFDIVTTDITANQPRIISSAQTTNGNPALDGSLAVWQSTVPSTTLKLNNPTTATWQIVGSNLSTPATGVFTVTSGAGDHINPAVSGTGVVWQENPNGHWAVAGQDVSTGSGFAATASADNQINPDIAGTTFVYVTQPLTAGQAPLVCGSPGRAIHEGDRSGGGDDIISGSGECDPNHPHATGGGRVVWDDEGGDIGSGKNILGKLCTVSYSDVHAGDYFAIPVQGLACVAAISGYSDGTFRPYNLTSRAQLCKIVVLGEGLTLNTSGGPHFSDVAVGSTFYSFIETAYNRGIISGYSDGTFRPSANVTRGQLSKIMVVAQGWPLDTSGGPHFSDVAVGTIFYPFVETAYHHGIVSGYSDGTFHPIDGATRGQIAKIAWGALQHP